MDETKKENNGGDVVNSARFQAQNFDKEDSQEEDILENDSDMKR